MHLFTACAFKVCGIIEQALTMTPGIFSAVARECVLVQVRGGEGRIKYVVRCAFGHGNK